MATDPDDLFEAIFKWTIPLWGPFYGVYYITRFVIRQMRSKK